MDPATHHDHARRPPDQLTGSQRSTADLGARLGHDHAPGDNPHANYGDQPSDNPHANYGDQPSDHGHDTHDGGHHPSDDGHHGHDRGGSLNRLSISATLHCMTGCLIGEVVGMSIATALGWGNAASIALAVALAFVFGYLLTSIPLLRAGLALSVVVPLALATDTASIALMELVDNATVALVPGAMDSHLNDPLYWASMLGGFAIAFPFAFLLNRALLRRGKGHALVHEYHEPPRPRTRIRPQKTETCSTRPTAGPCTPPANTNPSSENRNVFAGGGD